MRNLTLAFVHNRCRNLSLVAIIGFFSSQYCLAQDQLAESQTAQALNQTLELKGNPDKLPVGVTQAPHLLLISGDDEYRSEEALPMLAQILSAEHGIDCTVSFSINTDTNSIDPNFHYNNSGLENLADADAVILFTRFRQWPDDQMEMFEQYLKRGGPIVALRTATHPFAFDAKSESRFAKWSWNSKQDDWIGGFGQQIIGDTWVSHHGHHKSESTAGVIEPDEKDNPILRGVSDLWGPADVYGITHLPADATVLIRGQILSGMTRQDKPVTDGRNEPMMPIAWTKPYQYNNGVEGKVFCTTMCSAIDLKNAGIRRLVVNATYWSLGWADKIPESNDVTLPENYEPSMFGFQTEPGYFSSQNLHPQDYLTK